MTHRQLGDALFALSALAALRARRPAHRFVVVAPASLVGLLRCARVVDEVWERPAMSSLLPWWRIRRVRPDSFDAALAFARTRRSVLLAALSGAPRRVGYCGAHFPWLLTDVIGGHAIFSPRMALELVQVLEADVEPQVCGGILQLPERELRAGRRLLEEAGVDLQAPYIVMAPGGHRPDDPKLWPIERFAAVAATLTRDGWQVVVVGTEQEAQRATQICQEARRAADLTGRTSLLQLGAILRGARLFIGNDSGPAHLAAALGRRTLVIIGPTDPEQTGPRGEGHILMRHRMPCAPCYPRPTCAQRECLLAIEPNAVVHEAVRALGG